MPLLWQKKQERDKQKKRRLRRALPGAGRPAGAPLLAAAPAASAALAQANRPHPRNRLNLRALSAIARNRIQQPAQPQEQPQEEYEDEAPEPAAPQPINITINTQSADGAATSDEGAEAIQPPSEAGADDVGDDELGDDDMGDEPGIVFPLVSSHLHDGALCTIAICFGPNGPCVVSSKVRAPRARRMGPVIFGADIEPAVAPAIEKSRAILERRAEMKDASHAVGGLVDRAREGDQNAMAIIALVRDNAQKGELRARSTFGMLRTYIEEHPVTTIGAESDGLVPAGDRHSTYWASVMLANGAPITKSRVDEVLAFLEGYDRACFLRGLIECANPSKLARLASNLDHIGKRLIEIGKILGQARKLQVARLPHTKLSEFCPVVAWELGE